MRLILAPGIAEPLTRITDQVGPPLRVGLVQHRWHADEAELRAELAEGIRVAAAQGARVVFLPELTLRKYPGNARAEGVPKRGAEDLLTGPTFASIHRSAWLIRVTGV
ncbi:hypothetical protein [Cryobacterium sp. TmT2-59]|uniref:hypothetical protein n=1 Tax=Cryobacterium sp. TmT2-59 TaxID=1259264 RepID=UPI0018E07268|nr:hypothetical protein [Cryobacterium sp. TmT2-59]